jgi:hypothetical protein
VSARWHARYGASPVHLLAHLVLLPLVAWALLGMVDVTAAVNTVAWLVAAVILHDFVLLPAYATLDRIARRSLAGAINHVRVPAGISLLLALVYFPVISGHGAAVFHGVSGLRLEGYLQRWLLVTAALFALSALLYGARLLRGGSRR